MKPWFITIGTLGAVGIVMIFLAAVTASSNEALTTGAPQQQVVASWHIADLAQVIAGELALLVIAVSMIGVRLLSQTREISEAETTLPPPPA